MREFPTFSFRENQNLTMIADAAHHSELKTAHIIFGFILLLGLGLHTFWPLSVQSYVHFPALEFVAIPLLLLGSAIILLSKREMEIHDQPSEPGAATSMVVRTGIFRFSRNPLYLGVVIAFIGLALATDKLWWLILTPLALCLTHYLLIIPEEKYLENKFPSEYIPYKKRVRRWL